MSGGTILLTGTGSVGRELLLAFLRRSDARLAVLMRDRGRRSAVRRADALFALLGLTDEERRRVDVLRGDVSVPGLGLDDATLDRLARSLDLIVHTAAATSLTADRPLCEAVNRDGTAHTLSVAERCFTEGRLARFMHLSTALVAGGASAAVAREDELPTAPVCANHYEWSKYEAERIVRAAMHAGLPVTVFRPSMVVGDTDTGYTRDFNVIYPLMRLMASGYVTRFPADPQARLHLAPMNFVVDAILRAADAPWTAGLTFHLTAPEPPAVAELFDCDAFFPPGAARPHLCAPGAFDPAECSPRERELLESVSFCFPYFNSRLSFETTNTQRLVPLPVTDAAYLTRLGRYAVASGYLRHAVREDRQGRCVTS
jgi:long-chain acyl-CoA synthetase